MVAHNKIKEVFDFIVSELYIRYIPDDPILIDRTLALSNKLISLEEDLYNGIASWEKVQIEKAKLVHNVILLINRIPEIKFIDRSELKEDFINDTNENLPIKYQENFKVIKLIKRHGDLILQTIENIKIKEDLIIETVDRERILKLENELLKLKLKLKKYKQKYKKLRAQYEEIKKDEWQVESQLIYQEESDDGINIEFKMAFEKLKNEFSFLPDDWKEKSKEYLIKPFVKHSLGVLRGEFPLSTPQFYSSLLSRLSLDKELKAVRIVEFLPNGEFRHDLSQIGLTNHLILASKDGILVKRLFVTEKKNSQSFPRVLKEQLGNGILIRTVTPNLLTDHEDLVLSDTIILGDSNGAEVYVRENLLNSSGHKSERLILNIQFCKNAIDSFDSIWNKGEVVNLK